MLNTKMNSENINPQTRFESPLKRFSIGSHSDENSSPLRGFSFGSPSDENSSHLKRFSIRSPSDENSSPQKRSVSHTGTPESSPQKRVAVYPPAFTMNWDSPDPQIKKFAVPVPDFLETLSSPEVNVLSPVLPIQPMKPSSEKKIGEGSSAEVFKMEGGKEKVRKVYRLGTNGNNRGTRKHIDNKDLLKMLSAFNRSHGNPQCARVDGITIFKNGDIWEMNVEQEECSALTDKDVRRYLRCIISLLRDFIPIGQGQFAPTDFKKVNFGVDGNGEVVWIDFDFKKHEFGNVPDLCSSGEFIFNGNEKFQRLLLTILDFFLEVNSERKEAFRALNDQKSLLQGLGLLDSDKSIAETTIEDFRKILTKIGLCEEEIDFLVGVMTPPSSQ